jgi:hypothetical protein
MLMYMLLFLIKKSFKEVKGMFEFLLISSRKELRERGYLLYRKYKIKKTSFEIVRKCSILD